MMRPLVGQCGLQHPPSVALAAQQVGVGHARVGDEHLVEVRFAGDLDQWTDIDTGLAHRNHEEAQAFVLGHVPVGARDQQRVLRRGGTRRPHLLAVDHPLVTVADRGGAHRRQIRSSARFAVEQTGAGLFGQEVAQQVVLELFGAERERGVGRDAVLVLARTGRLDRPELLFDDRGERTFGYSRPNHWVGYVGTA